MMASLAGVRARPLTATQGLAACCAVAVAALAFVVVDVNRQAACSTGDTFLVDLCPAPPRGPAQAQALRARIARNPGDTNAYRELALTDASASHNRLIDTAQRLAPNQPQLLVHQAAAAFDRGDAAAAVAPLIKVVDHYDAPLQAQALAQMITMGEGHLLAPHLTRSSRWPARVLAQMGAAGGSISSALPLIIPAARLQVLDAATLGRYVNDLKAAGAWADAYALWLAMQGARSVPVLFNGGFDQPFQPYGFDWEVPDTTPRRRAGVIVERRGSDNRAGVLDLQFTGRSIALPIIRQQLFLAPGKYRLRGDHQARQFRAEQGLVWTLHCDAARVGTSPGLGDTGGTWRAFAVDFTVPRSCGLVVRLQLETPGAGQGARGRVAFDALSIERLAD